MNIRNILLVAATRLEIEPLLSTCNIAEIQTGRVTQVMLKQMPLDILITGPGMVPTAFYLGKLRGLQQYSLVLNAGIAGSFNAAMRIKDVVQVTSDCFPELGCVKEEKLEPMYGMSMAEAYRLPCIDQYNIIRNTLNPALNALNALPQAKGITVNAVTGKPWESFPQQANYAPDVETMEGAAFFFACLSLGVACVQIRAISNRIAPPTPEAWDFKGAVDALHEVLLTIFDEL
jgi:futalosine hydrolase